MINIAICDDDIIYRNKIFEIFKEFCNTQEFEFECDVFESGVEMLNSCDKNGYKYDFVFLDIIMDEVNGLEVANVLKEKNKNIEIIFISTSRDFVFESFDYNAFDYLVKPIEEEKVKKIIERVIGKLKSAEVIVPITNGKSTELVKLDDIHYISVDGRIITVHCEDNEYKFYGKIDNITEQISKLSNYNFIKPHRSYLVNPKYIKTLERIKLVLKSGVSIPVSRLRYTDLKNELMEYYKVINF